MTEPSNETALAKRDPNAGAVELVSPSAFNLYVAEMQKKAHVLSPVTQLGSLPSMWKLVPAVIFLNPDVNVGEVYRDRLFCEEGEVAITKVGLRRLAQAGGMSTGATRLDDGHIQFYWSFQGFIQYRGFDGQKKTQTASVEWDLRDGSQQVNRMVKAAERNRKPTEKRDARAIAATQIDAARHNGYRNAESRAINAAVREFGLRQKYTVRELSEKPFVVFNMVANPDMSDPEQKRMVLQHALGAESLLYGGAPALPAGDPPQDAPPVNHATGEIIEQDPPVERPFEDDPPATDDSVLIAGVTQIGDDYWITTDKGLRYRTKDRDIAKACHDARKAEKRIVITPHGGEIVEIRLVEKL